MAAEKPSDVFQRALKGDRDAFDALFRETHPRLCAFANSILHDRALADDCVQDVFVKLWVDRKNISNPLSARAYLFASVRNNALNKLASAAVRARWEQSEGVDVAGMSGEMPDVELLKAERVADLQTAFARLSPRTKAAATLRWYDELSYAEIAVALGMSEKTVENHLARALKSLRASLGA